jgi:hypothetical protein
MKQINFILFLLALTIGSQATAQSKPAGKYKPPPLFTQLGIFRDSVKLNTTDVIAVINQPLKIFDDKKVPYAVSSYQLIYKKKAVTENEETGKVTPITSIVASQFTKTPLPEIWINQVRAQVQPGEELLFFDVIAKDAQGRVMYAPNFKIVIIQ